MQTQSTKLPLSPDEQCCARWPDGKLMALSSLLCEGTPCQQSLKGDGSTVKIYWKRRQHVNIYWKVGQHVNIRWKRKPVVLLSRFDENSPCVAPSACRARAICIRAHQGETPIHLHLFLCAPGSRGEKSNLNCFFFRFNSPGASKTRALPNLLWIISHIFHTTLLHWVHYLAVLLGYTQSNMSMPRAQHTTRST